MSLKALYRTAVFFVLFLVACGIESAIKYKEQVRRAELVQKFDREEAEIARQKVEAERERVEAEQDKICITNSACRTSCQNRCLARLYCPGAKD